MVFSVIIPFLNEEKYIEKCILSLLNQDFDKKKYELFFIDNGSTDRSVEIVSKYAVTLLRETKEGSYAARNRGILAAKGEIIAFTDADCSVSRCWLNEIYSAMCDDKVNVVLGKRYFGSKASFSLGLLADYENTKISYIIKKSLRDYFFGFTNNMAIKASVLKEAGLFYEPLNCGDTEYVQRLVSGKNYFRIAYLPEMKIEHLEIFSLQTYIRKIYTYGKSSFFLGKISTYKKLNLRLQIRIAFYCINQNCYTFWKRISFFLLLAFMNIFYVFGNLEAAGDYNFKNNYAKKRY